MPADPHRFDRMRALIDEHDLDDQDDLLRMIVDELDESATGRGARWRANVLRDLKRMEGKILSRPNREPEIAQLREGIACAVGLLTAPTVSVDRLQILAVLRGALREPAKRSSTEAGKPDA